MHSITNMLSSLSKRSSWKELSKAYIAIAIKSGAKDIVAKKKNLIELVLVNTTQDER